jgi:hypothetical protein
VERMISILVNNVHSMWLKKLWIVNVQFRWMLFVLHFSSLIIFRIFTHLDFVNIFTLECLTKAWEFLYHPFFTVGVEPFWDQVVSHFLEVSFSTFCFFDAAMLVSFLSLLIFSCDFAACW